MPGGYSRCGEDERMRWDLPTDERRTRREGASEMKVGDGRTEERERESQSASQQNDSRKGRCLMFGPRSRR